MIGQESESSTVRLCKGCKHFIAPDWCSQFIIERDLITGMDLMAKAHRARGDWSMCGREAKLFEPTWWHKFTNKVFK